MMSDVVHYRPGTALEVESLVAEAAADARAIEVCGGGSKRPMWSVLSTARLDMSALAGITDYDPDELVLTALAGTPLSVIETALEERGQILAFDPFDHGPLFGEAAGRATLGGIIAANVSGPRRISAGAARDHILGFKGVSGRGQALKAGGAVVKNVTGFDLPKLMAGSWGTLAVLTSITVRVLPRPRTEKTLLFRGLSAEMANRLMTRSMGLSVAVSCAAHLAGASNTTGLRLEGFGPSVDARCRDLITALPEFPPSETLAAEESALFWRGVRALDSLPLERHALWRITVAPASGWRVGAALEPLTPVVYDWAGGLIWIALADAPPYGAGIKLRGAARAAGGHATLIRAPNAMRSALAPEVGPAGLRQLQQRVKAAFDPAGILNPGIDPAAAF